jgi:hypothetical protein
VRSQTPKALSALRAGLFVLQAEIVLLTDSTLINHHGKII